MRIIGKILACHDRFWLIRLILIKVIFLLLLSIPLQIVFLPEFSALYVVYAILGLIVADIMLFNHYYKRDQLYLFFVISIVTITKILSMFVFNYQLFIFISIFTITLLLYLVKFRLKIYSVLMLSFILSIFAQKIFYLSDVYNGDNFGLYFFICASYLFWMDKIVSFLYEHIWRLTSSLYIGKIIEVVNEDKISYTACYAIYERLKLVKNKRKQILAKRFYDDISKYNYFIHWLKKDVLNNSSNFDDIINDLKALQEAIISNHIAFYVVQRTETEYMQIHNELFDNLVNSWNELCN